MFQGSQRNLTTRKLRTTNLAQRVSHSNWIRPEGPLVDSLAREDVGSTRIKTERRRCGSNQLKSSGDACGELSHLRCSISLRTVSHALTGMAINCRPFGPGTHRSPGPTVSPVPPAAFLWSSAVVTATFLQPTGELSAASAFVPFSFSSNTPKTL